MNDSDIPKNFYLCGSLASTLAKAIVHAFRRSASKACLHTLICLCFVMFIVDETHAENSLSDPSVISKIVPLSDKFHNNIELLNNRFRVDSDIKEVTLVFFREYGAQPIVLVRPDGSKLHLENDLDDDSYEWFETVNYDMISLKNPMPGPWQAVGEILPNSRVMVIAGITLNAQAIPEVVYSGETLKQTAYIENAGSRVNMAEFKDVVSLSIEFVSTNNPSFANFGLGTRQVARFHDNGLDFDEENSDGVFTGEFNLNIIEGEWQPIFTIRTPLFSREQSTPKVVLRPNPVSITHSEEYFENGNHLIEFDVDRKEIDVSSVLISGNARTPEGEEVSFSQTVVSDFARKVEIINSDYGVYRINAKVFAQTHSGRDIVLSIPEYSFFTREPIVEEVVEPVAEINEIDQQLEQLEKEVQVEEANTPILFILFINLALLFVGCIVIFLLYDRRRNPNNHFALKMTGLLKSVSKITFKRKQLDEQNNSA